MFLYVILGWIGLIVYGDTHNCDTSNKCRSQNNGIIECKPNEDCMVICSEDDACAQTTVKCPANNRCEIHCINPFAHMQCHSMIIHAEASSFLFINASIGDAVAIGGQEDPNTMDWAKVFCPITGPYTTDENIACEINCDGDDLLRGTKIFAVEGFHDVNIVATRYRKKWCYRAGTMVCKEDYSSNCSMINDGNENYPPLKTCSNLASDVTCENYLSTPAPTTTETPTQNPTSIPTIIPTKSPSLSPTNDPSLNPTQNPSLFPSQNPTNAPSKEPTNFPTFNPSSNPSITPSVNPTLNPTNMPSSTPTTTPSTDPTLSPSDDPSLYPTFNPTHAPITSEPSSQPSVIPSVPPTSSPVTRAPTNYPSLLPSTNPIVGTTISPSFTPSSSPITSTTSSSPSSDPTVVPSQSLNPSINPTSSPTTKGDTLNPTVSPSLSPSINITSSPSLSPTVLTDSQTIDHTPSIAIFVVVMISIASCIFFCILFIFFFKYENAEKFNNLDSKHWRKKQNEKELQFDDDSDFYDSGQDTESLPIYTTAIAQEGGGRISRPSYDKMKTKDNEELKQMIKEQEEREKQQRERKTKKKHRKSKSDELFSKHLNDFTMKQEQIFDEQILQKISNDEDPIMSTDYSSQSEQSELRPMRSTKKSIFDSFRFRSKSRSQTKSNRSSFSKTPQFTPIGSISDK